MNVLANEHVCNSERAAGPHQAPAGLEDAERKDALVPVPPAGRRLRHRSGCRGTDHVNRKVTDLTMDT